MKTENTLENKAKFFAPYLYQNVYRNKHWVSSEKTVVLDPYISTCQTDISHGYLLLTPLSQITDEDAIEVARIILTPALVDRYKESWIVSRDFTVTGYPYIKIYHPKNIYKVQIDCALVNFDLYDMEDSCTSSHDMKPYHVVTYLLSKSYYLGDGTEIEYGWIKLNEE